MKYLHLSARWIAALSVIAALSACTSTSQPVDPAARVNLKIGTGGHGHIFVGANVPFGMVQVGPTSINQEWDWCSGYHDGDSTVIGFSHTHLSGTGVGDLFDITLMPVVGDPVPARGREDDPLSGLWSYGDRTQEIAEPGYYSIPLLRYGIRAEMTATSRVGFHRYTFPASDNAALVVDLENGGCWDRVTDVAFLPETDADGKVVALSGWRYSRGWSEAQRVYFRAELSRPAESFSVIGPEDRPYYGRLQFGMTAEGEQLLVKVALSPVDTDGAAKNLAAELPGWDFDGVRQTAWDRWNAELSKITVRGGDPDTETIFYTALYHTMIAPSEFSDVDGRYRGSDGNIYEGDFMNYTTFSLWDTYRAQHPLLAILQPERMDDFIRTMYRIYVEQGDLPVWHLWGCETNCMVGDPGLIAFADGIVKGFRGGLGDEEILRAMLETAANPERGKEARLQYGFIPSDLVGEAVAKDMEFAVADAALAEAADTLGRPDIAAEFRHRSHSYRYHWDPVTRFMRGVKTDGQFTEPFEPLVHSGPAVTDYTEGTPWQYIWLVPQDVEGLVDLFGSREACLAKLDSLFTLEFAADFAVPDITGLIGQYAHGNEPGHHTIYLYSMLGEPAKAADRIRQVYREMYANAPDGLSGNEDVGQMSAWYILSALGFYQVEPAVPHYWFGAPLFPEAEVVVSGGTFRVIADGLSEENRYIQSVRLNGEPYALGYITYADIVRGGELCFEMGPEPKCWY